MANQENLYYKLKLDVENLEGFLQKVKEAQAAITGASRPVTQGVNNAPNPSASGSPLARSAKEAIDGFQNNPKLKEDLNEINNLIGGMKLVGDEKTKQDMMSKVRKYYGDLSKEIVGSTQRLDQELSSKGLGKEQRMSAIEKAAQPYMEGLASAESTIKEDLSKASPSSKRNLRTIGMYVLAGVIEQLTTSIFSYEQSKIMVGAQNVVATGMGFNFTSLAGFQASKHEAMMSNQMREAELSKQGSSSLGLGIGTVAGMLLGLGLGVATGGAALPFMVTGGMIGGTIGQGIGSTKGTEEIAELIKKQLPLKEMDKAVPQFLEIANTFEKAWTGLDTARARFKARSDHGNISGRGYGYSDERLYQLGTMQAGITGSYDPNTFRAELAFSRAHGYDPSEIFQASVLTRYTGQKIGAQELGTRQNIANLTGMGNRVPELLQAMNNLAVVMTKTGAPTTEETIRQTTLLPYAIWGNTARGRLGDLGMDTLGQVNNMFNQQMGSPGDVFLYNAMRQQTGGDIWKFQLAKEKGAFDFNNIKSVFEGAQKYAGGDQTILKQTLKSLGMSANMSEQMVNKAYNYKGEEGEGIEGWLKHLEKLSQDTEEQKKFMAELDSEAKKNTSSSEKFYASFENSLSYPGGGIAKNLREIMKQQLETQKKLVENKENWDEVKKYLKLTSDTFLNEFKRIVRDFEAYLENNKNEEEKNEGLSESEKNFIYNNEQAGKEGKDTDNIPYKQKFRETAKLIQKALNNGTAELVKSSQIEKYVGSYYFPLIDENGNKMVNEVGETIYVVPKNGMDLGNGHKFYVKDSEEASQMRDYYIAHWKKELNDKPKVLLPYGSSPFDENGGPKGQGNKNILLNVPTRMIPYRSSEQGINTIDKAFSAQENQNISVNFNLDANALESLDGSLAKLRRTVITTLDKAQRAQESQLIGLNG